MKSLPERMAPWLAALVLATMGALAGGSALRESLTVDEPAHLAAGVSYLQRLDLRMNVEHPPLAKAWAALPLVLRGVAADYDGFSWTFAGRGPFHAYLAQWPFGHWLLTRWNDPATTLAWGRFPMLLLMLGLGALLYAYGSRLGGQTGGLLCACLFAATPAFLAFGPLVVTDVAVTFFTVLTLWTYAAMWQAGGEGRGEGERVAFFSLSLAGALLSKFSSGVLLFAFVAFQLSLRWRPPAVAPPDPADARAWRRRGWRRTLKGILGAALVVYAVYFFLGLRQPTSTLAVLGEGPASLLLRRLLMPAWTFVLGLLLFAMASARPTFILGHVYPHSVWFYFPVLFLLKTPLASLGLFLLAIPVAVAARGRRRPGVALITPGWELHWRALWVFLLVVTASCLLSPMNISIRHFLVPIALSILLLAPLPRAVASLAESGWRPARPLGWVSAALVLVSLATVVGAYPHYIPFLNSLRLGRDGFLLVNDSNLDWSQSLPEVRRFADERGLDRVLLDTNGFTEPTLYVPQARLWDCQRPGPEDAGLWAVVSGPMVVDWHNCTWLLEHPRQTLAGGSMYAFRLPARIPAAGEPGGPPRPAEFRNWGGMPGRDFRAMLYSCVRDPRQMGPVIEEMEREARQQWEQRRKKQ